MNVYVLWRGDGYGHNGVMGVYSSEQAAWAGARKELNHVDETAIREMCWVEEQTVQNGERCEACGRGGDE